ncbi:MAG TPA: glycosyltransferase family 39 protein [Acidimicrobiales bacterium]
MSVITLPEPSVSEPAPAAAATGRSRLATLVRGRTTDPAWVRPSLLALLTVTGVLYLWGLGASGWANSFYSAAVQAGSSSWKAFFFGSSDAANFITVDKPPASLWVMDLSARVFGVNAWSILVPQALEGVAAVGVLYAAVRRWFSPAAGLFAGAILALTPVSALMFRFNNPDALLVLLLVAAAYAMVRALEGGRTRWLVLAGTLVGFGFLTKMLQAFLVVPAFALVYLLAGPPKLGRRIVQLVAMGGALLASAGWWVAIVELIPASARPYIGGSQDNSVLNLIFGYNGFGRLTGNETGSVGGGGGQAGRWGPTGWTRLFNSEFGGQISWLLPAALVLLGAGLVMTARAKRTDRTRSALLLWGGWLFVSGAVFSLSQGIIHPYYSVALAPAIGAIIGIGATLLWRHRDRFFARALMAATLVVTACWANVLLQRTPDWNPWLRGLILFTGFTAAAAVLAAPRLRGWGARAVVATALVAALAGPTAYSVATAATPHSGAIPSAGPTAAGGFGPGGFGGGGRAGGFGGFGQFPRFGANGGGTAGGPPAGAFGGGGGTAGAPGGLGGLLNGSTPTSELTATLDQDASDYTWVAAAVGANEASGYQLATDDPVMAIGGFNGTDPTPTLAQFQAYVAAGRIHFFIGGGRGGGFGPGGGSSSSSAIASWVESNFRSTTVGGVTLYDLTSPA